MQDREVSCMQDREVSEFEHGGALRGPSRRVAYGADLEAACTELHHQIMSAAVRHAKDHQRGKMAGEGPAQGRSARRGGASERRHGEGFMSGAYGHSHPLTALSFPMSRGREPPASPASSPHPDSGSVAATAAALLTQLDLSGSHFSRPEHPSWNPTHPSEEEEERRTEGVSSNYGGGNTASKVTTTSLPELQLADNITGRLRKIPSTRTQQVSQGCMILYRIIIPHITCLVAALMM